jgi:hypothetical protein
MNPNLSLLSDGKKFMWDGRSLETAEEAARVAEGYQKEGFEVRTVMEGGKFLIYTRRVVKAAAAPVA